MPSNIYLTPTTGMNLPSPVNLNYIIEKDENSSQWQARITWNYDESNITGVKNFKILSYMKNENYEHHSGINETKTPHHLVAHQLIVYTSEVKTSIL